MVNEIMNTTGDNDPVALFTSVLPAIIAVCKTGVEDKNSQVNFGAFDLLDEAIENMNKYKISHHPHLALLMP